MTLAYNVVLTPDEDTLLVTCPDLPEVTTFGQGAADALLHAADAIEEAIAARIADGEDVPAPSLRRRKHQSVALPTQATLKLSLYWVMREDGITRAELTRRLGWKRESVERLFRLDHATRLEQYDAAFRALGRNLSISTEEIAA